jgi:hypothetical protein
MRHSEVTGRHGSERKEGGRERGREGGRADLHKLTWHDRFLVLLPEVEGAVVERLVVVLLQHVFPAFVQVLEGGGAGREKGREGGRENLRETKEERNGGEMPRSQKNRMG